MISLACVYHKEWPNSHTAGWRIQCIQAAFSCFLELPSCMYYVYFFHIYITFITEAVHAKNTCCLSWIQRNPYNRILCHRPRKFCGLSCEWVLFQATMSWVQIPARSDRSFHLSFHLQRWLDPFNLRIYTNVAVIQQYSHLHHMMPDEKSCVYMEWWYSD